MKSKGGYWKRLASFSTAAIVCIAMLALFQSTSAEPDVILSEGFESYDPGIPGGIPPDWYVHDNDGDGYSWEGYHDAYDAYEGEYYVRCHYSWDYCDDWLVTEKVHISASGDTVQFYAKAYSSYYEESWEVWITETGYNVSDFLDNGDMIGSDSTSSDSYQLYTYNIPTRYNDHDVWIAIRCTSYSAYYLCIDAFSLPNSGYFEGFEGVPPSGFPPAGWTSEVVTGTDVDNNWTGSDGTDTHPAGVTPHSGSAMAQYDCFHINTGNSARLYTPLVDLSGYTNCQLTFWMYHDENYYDREDKLVIQASLDGTTWTNLSTFYRCTAGYFPDWISFTNDSSDYGKWVNYKGTKVHSGNYSVKGDPGSLYSTPHSDAWLITPRLSLSSSPGDLTFWYRAESDGYWVAFKVLVSTSADPLDFSSYTEVADINATSSTWTQASIDMSAYANQQVYIALKMYDSKSSYYYVFIDDFALDGWSDDFEPYVGWAEHTVDLSAYDGQNIYVGFLGVSDFGNSIYIDDVSIAGTPAGVNQPPVAVDDSYSTPQDTSLDVPAPGVLGNDYDPDNGPSSLTAELVSGPSHGTLTFNSDGSFVYTPNTGFSGTDTFTYRAFDGANYSNVATVTINVTVVPNIPPVAVNDTFLTAKDTPLNVPAPGVLGNDFDPDSGPSPLTAELVSGPSYGTLTLNSDGSFSYVPTVAGFTGIDTFTYKAYDGKNYSNIATVTIAVPTNVSTFNVTQADFNLTGFSSNPDGDPSTPTLPSSGPDYPNITNVDGAYNMDIPPAGIKYIVVISGWLEADFDEDGTWDEHIDFIKNIGPRTSPGPSTSWNGTMSIPVTYNGQTFDLIVQYDVDVDGKYPSDSFGPNAHAYFIISGPDIMQFNAMLAYLDNTSGGDDGYIDGLLRGVISVSCVPCEPPAVAVDDSYLTYMNVPLDVPAPGVLGNDYDPNNGPSPLAAVLVDGPSHGTLVLNDNGSFTYTPETNFCGTDTFTYKAYDGMYYSNVATVTINVVTIPPVAENDSYSTCMDTTLTISAPGVLSNDYDPDNGPSPLTAVLVSGPYHGTLTLNSDGSFTYVPDAGFDGTDSFTYKAYDGANYSNVATVEICVVKVVADAGGPYDADYRTGFTVHFDSSGTYITPCYTGDVDYYWDFGDGTYSTEPNPVHSYSPAEDQFEVTVTLTVTVHTDSGDCSDTDTTTVTFHKEVSPLPQVQIISPRDGETVSGTVKIKWYAYDPAYQGREEELPIYIFYKPVDKEQVFKIAGPIANTGEYDWNTNNIAPGDYLLIVEAVGPRGIGHDSVRITIAGAGPGVGVNVRIEDTTISSDKWVKDGDTVEITAAITGTLASTFSAQDIRADLSAFNLGTSVPADSYDGFIAKWTIHNVQCKPSNGVITVKVDVAGITTGMATITADNSKPSLEIVKPTYGIYIFGIRILPVPFSKAIIIGPITAKVNVIDNFGAEKVEYYIDGELVEVVNKEPFDWKASLPAGLHELKVKAYDHAQNVDIKSVSFLKLF